MAAVRIIGMSYVLFVFISGFMWLHSESTAAASTQSVWQQLSGMSTYEQMLIKPMGNDARTHLTDTVEGAAEVSVPFNPSPSTVHSAASSLTHGIPLSPEASSSEPQSFQGTVQSAVAHPRDPQTNDQQLSSDETVLQRSVENLLGSSEILTMNPNSLSVYAGLLHPSEDSPASNAGALHSREDAAVSCTEKFVRNHASSVVGTEKLRAPPQTSSLDDSVIDDRPQRTVQPSYQTVTTSGVHGGIDMVSTTIQHIDVLPTSASELCCNATTISPSLTLGSDSSFPAHAPASGSSAPDSSNNVERLPTAQKMHVVKLREDAGFITTPGFNNSQKYPSNIYDQHCIVMSPSDGQTMLLSFPYFDLEGSSICEYDYLEMFSVRENNKTHLWKKCGFSSLSAEIISEPAICLVFKSDKITEETGFNVTYSFLPGSPDDYRLDDEFDCSNMDSFHRSLHFDCNFALECHDKQDEMNCSYSSQECPGLVSVGDKCYTNKRKRGITWLAASRECSRHNQILVSPQSPQEWNTFVNITGNLKQSVTVYLGLQHLDYLSTESLFYLNSWRWLTKTIAFHVGFMLLSDFYSESSQPSCTVYSPHFAVGTAYMISCSQPKDILVMCESLKEPPRPSQRLPPVSLQTGPYELSNIMAECSSGFLVRNYLECDFESHCHDFSQEECLQKSEEPRVDLFSCQTASSYFVHYTLLCDHISDCPDASDESFCTFDKCPQDTCRNGQCFEYNRRCDGSPQCLDSSDETCLTYHYTPTRNLQQPVIVEYSSRGVFTTRSQSMSDTCPDTHFRCQNGDCLPVYLRCNRVNDCLDHEDEDPEVCIESSCPGYFRCRGSSICVHPSYVCDNVSHCPQHDDEALCHQNCPQQCRCQGLAFVCSSPFVFHSYPDLRYLHIDSSSLTVVDLTSNTYLVLLRLSNCKLKTISSLKLDSLRNLQTLDLRDNLLVSGDLNAFVSLGNLRSLVLTGNPLKHIIPFSVPSKKLKNLDLSYTLLNTINQSTLLTYPKIQTLNLSNSALQRISRDGLNSSTELMNLDLSGTLLKSYPVKMLRYLSKLKHVWANDFTMCCQAALPEGFDLEHCHAPQDNIASCDDLLRSAVYRSFLWIIAVFAMIGNTGSFVARLLLTKELRRRSFGLFVLNLSISDFLMGVYLTMIGVADQTFRGQYWWRVDSWKNSAVCKTAGFLSLLSSEVSAFFICLITIDRLLVLRFPFSRLHFEYRSTLVACVFAWIVGLVLAGVPLLPLTSQWDFYGQTGICLPLPFTSRGAFSGYFYSFGVMIVLNFVLFMLIAIGQVFIYWSVRTRHKSELRKHIKSSDVAIARRLIAIVLSDFMCWFPTGILGLWAFTDNTVNSDINVTVAIFVMPFNAAFNPFLYTLNLVMDKRRKAAEARMMLRLQATMHSEIKRVDTVTKRRSGDMAVRENRHLRGGQELPLELQARPLPKLAALNQVDNWLKDGTLSPPEISSLIDATKMYMQKE